MFKCTGVTVNEVPLPGTAEKRPVFTVKLTPTDGSEDGAVRVIGGPASVAATLTYGRLYAIGDAPASDPAAD